MLHCFYTHLTAEKAKNSSIKQFNLTIKMENNIRFVGQMILLSNEFVVRNLN